MLKRVKNKLTKIVRKVICPTGFYFNCKGFCPCCDKEVTFEANDSWLREYFICSNCQSIPRERALMLNIQKYYPNWRDLEIHESSPSNRGASLKLKNKCSKYTSSQYYPHLSFGTVVNDFRNEDLENQTFKDETFDIVVTLDVMEHLYNPQKAFSEIARTLKKGGAHIFTVPLINKHNQSEIWAVKGKQGAPEFLKKEEYHSNPVDEKGSPVTMHWGFDIVDFIKAHSGLDTTIEYIDDLKYGVRAEFIEVLISKK